jgi:hypothetical protein
MDFPNINSEISKINGEKILLLWKFDFFHAQKALSSKNCIHFIQIQRIFLVNRENCMHILNKTDWNSGLKRCNF